MQSALPTFLWWEGLSEYFWVCKNIPVDLSLPCYVPAIFRQKAAEAFGGERVGWRLKIIGGHR
jgi:hypothetical protein